MTWLAHGAELVNPEAEANALERLLEAVSERINTGTAVPEDEILQDLAAGIGLDGRVNLDNAAQHLAEKLLGDIRGLDTIKRLRSKLAHLETKSETDRTIGWPDLNGDISANAGLFTFKLDTAGGVSFIIVRSDDGEDNTADEAGLAALSDDVAKTQLTLEGRVKPEISLTASPGPVSLTARFAFGFDRSLVFHGAYDDGVRTGRALVDAFRRLSDPSNFDDVLDAFEKTAPEPKVDPDGRVPQPLDKIVYSGELELDAAVGMSATLPFKFGTVTPSAKADIALEDKFETTIRRAGPGVLNVRSTGGKSNERTLELGLKVSVGISALVPGFAKQLLGELTEISTVLDRIDAVLEGDVSTWLMPGTALKSKLGEWLNESITGTTGPATALRSFLSDVFGTGDTTPNADLAASGADYLASLIDNALDLFKAPGSDENTFANILDGLSESIFPQLGNKIDRAKLEDALRNILNRAETELSEQLDEAAGNLDDAARSALTKLLGRDPSNLVRDVRKVLNQARSILAKIAAGLGEDAMDALAIEIGFRRQQSEAQTYSAKFDVERAGAAFYKDFIRRPRKNTPKLIYGDPPGVFNIDDTETWLMDVLRNANTFSFGVSIFGASAKASRTRLDQVDILRRRGAMTLATKGEVRREKHALFTKESRAFSFVNLLSLGPSEEIAKPSLGLSLQHRDNNLKVREVRAMLRGFEKKGLVDLATTARVEEVVRKAADSGTGKLDADLELMLALPPSEVLDFVERAAEDQRAVSIMAREMAASDVIRDGIDRKLQGIQIRSSLMTANESHDYLAIIMNANELQDELTDVFRRGQPRLSTTAMSNLSWWGTLADARDSLKIAFQEMLGAKKELAKFRRRFENEVPGESDIARLERALAKRQKRINKTMHYWLNPGSGGVFNRIPDRAVTVFSALQKLSVAVLGADKKPPLLIKYVPDKQNGRGRPALFMGRPDL